MSEPQDEPRQPGTDDQTTTARTGDDAGRRGEVRTHGETAVDEAMGTGDDAR